MNWFYDHMRFVPRHRPVVICDVLENRAEFLNSTQSSLDPAARLGPRLWNRLNKTSLLSSRCFALATRERHGPALRLGYVAVDDRRLVHSLDLPWVVSFYGADVYLLGRDPAWVRNYRWVFERASRILSLGPAMSAGLEAIGCPAHKIVIHPLGVDAVALRHQPRVRAPDDPLRILFAGTFREKKGARYLIEAASILKSRGVPLTLTLVGDAAGRPGDQQTKDEIFALLAKYGLDTVCTQHQWLSFEKLIDVGLASHVFVVPSVTAEDGDAEGTPAVMGQMMATGMPTVATRHSDIPYTFGPYADRLVAERDSMALAERLQPYYDDPEAMTREGLEYRAHILATFDTRICAGALSSVYDTL
ncbi:MAG: glycosyltransferase [Gemmatimonadetes bacterium]|nr:glycosyltransferase [Gemmatimonadota bacterium]